ncbi:hypothetical protein V502_09159 [Pseudogymnoascus sp. VKM F-4520 (FW-2644)]|nr:hypothetical protein V502_09159 [Pseudogymnoascus sp. VKM F-4520 (FW-2644)]
MASLLPPLRRALPKLGKDLFTCRQCPKSASIQAPKLRTSKGLSAFQPTRFYNSSAPLRTSAATIPGAQASPLSSLSQTIANSQKETVKKSFFPETSSRGVAFWLLGSAASVFGIVVFGGLTRLTESGLSITEWRPVTGTLPPLSAADWDSEFDKYRASPEFKLLNPTMTLDEFKYIYFMEWTHRLWGRVIGLSFVLPAVYFVARRRVSRPLTAGLAGISAIIGIQGFIGWWMVKSGLKDDLFAPGSHPRVSQYRLAAHLGTAFICYATMLWGGLSTLRDRALLADPARGHASILERSSPALRLFRRSVGVVALLVFTTAVSGALVAGLDAGLIYNEFPTMGPGRIAPPATELFNDFYSRREDKADLWWRNILENPSTVQLDHRILATTTLTTIIALWAYSRFNPRVAAAIPKNARRGMMGVVHFGLAQVALGITTLLYLVPLPLASAHQACSMGLLTMTLVLGSRLWVPKRSLRLVKSSMAQAAQGAPKVRVPAAARGTPTA